MKTIIRTCALCVGVCALALTASALAKAPTHGSELNVSDPQRINRDEIQAIGWVESPEAKCVSDRQVQLLFDYGGQGFAQADLARTSDNGWFVGVGVDENNNGFVQTIKVKLTQKTFRKNGRKHVCKGASKVFE